MATTISYAVLAAAIWKPLFDQTAISGVGLIFASFSILTLLASLYIVPLGEYDAAL